MIYSQITNSFYDESLQYQSIPNDAIIVSTQEYNDAIIARSQGAYLSIVSGALVIGDIPEQTLESLKLAKTVEIKAACRNAIFAGIDSDALGTNHHYPATTEDQINISGLFTRSISLGAGGEPYKFWCADSVGVWARRSHTTAQIQAVGQAIATHVIDMQDIYETKLADIAAAVDASEVNAIAW